MKRGNKLFGLFASTLLMISSLTGCIFGGGNHNNEPPEHDHVWYVDERNEDQHCLACEICGERKWEDHKFIKTGQRSDGAFIDEDGDMRGELRDAFECSVCGNQKQEEVEFTECEHKPVLDAIKSKLLDKECFTAQNYNDTFMLYEGAWRNPERYNGVNNYLQHSWVKLKKVISEDACEVYHVGDRYLLRGDHYTYSAKQPDGTYMNIGDSYGIKVVLDSALNIVSFVGNSSTYKNFNFAPSEEDINAVKKAVDSGKAAFTNAKNKGLSAFNKVSNVIVRTRDNHYKTKDNKIVERQFAMKADIYTDCGIFEKSDSLDTPADQEYNEKLEPYAYLIKDDNGGYKKSTAPFDNIVDANLQEEIEALSGFKVLKDVFENHSDELIFDFNDSGRSKVDMLYVAPEYFFELTVQTSGNGDVTAYQYVNHDEGECISYFEAMAYTKTSGYGYIPETIYSLVHTHTFPDTYESDEYYHWKVSNCGHNIETEKETHTFGDWQTETAAVEGTDGRDYRECLVCGYRETKVTHVHKFIANHDENGHWEECEYCHKQKEDSYEMHNYVYTHDNNYHWRECEVCHQIDYAGKSRHTMGAWEYDRAHGLKTHQCTNENCDYEESEVIPTLDGDEPANLLSKEAIDTAFNSITSVRETLNQTFERYEYNPNDPQNPEWKHYEMSSMTEVDFSNQERLYAYTKNTATSAAFAVFSQASTDYSYSGRLFVYNNSDQNYRYYKQLYTDASSSYQSVSASSIQLQINNSFNGWKELNYTIEDFLAATFSGFKNSDMTHLSYAYEELGGGAFKCAVSGYATKGGYNYIVNDSNKITLTYNSNGLLVGYSGTVDTTSTNSLTILATNIYEVTYEYNVSIIQKTYL